MNTLRGYSNPKKIRKKKIPGVDIDIDVREYDFPTIYNAAMNTKVKRQLASKLDEIGKRKQFQLYKKEFDKRQLEEEKKNKMPKIRVIPKKKIKYIKEGMDPDTFNKAINEGEGQEEEHNTNTGLRVMSNVTREELMKEVQFRFKLYGIHFHPEPRSQFGLTMGDGKIYLYGGLGSRKYGDIWECILAKPKNFIWTKLFESPIFVMPMDPLERVKCEDKMRRYNDNGENSGIKFKPLARYGHSLHYYQGQLFVVGGYFTKWKENSTNEPLLLVYDLQEKRWYKDPSMYTPYNYLNEKDESYIENNDENVSITTHERNKKELKKEIPCLRRNHCSLMIRNTLFIYGGVNQSQEFLNDCWVYNAKKKEWVILEITGRYPPQLAYSCCALALEEDKLYDASLNIFKVPSSTRKTLPLLKEEGIFFFGGMNDNKIPTNLFFMLEIGKRPMEFRIPKTNGKPPEPRISASMNYYSPLSYLIIHGGRNENMKEAYFNDFEIMDLESMTWFHTTFFEDKIPPRRAEHSTLLINNRLLILGGCDEKELNNFDSMLVMLDVIS